MFRLFPNLSRNCWKNKWGVNTLRTVSHQLPYPPVHVASIVSVCRVGATRQPGAEVPISFRLPNRPTTNGGSRSSTAEGPQKLPPNLKEDLFKSRLEHVWAGLMKSEMTPNWRSALSRKPPQEWLSSIERAIPKDVRDILSGLEPPRFRSIGTLPLINTNDAGVYARLVTASYKFQPPGERYLYIGSATSYGGGLNQRISQHVEKGGRHGVPRLRDDIQQKKLKAPGHFVTLMTMKMIEPRRENILEVRRTVVLAEAILTVWLGALQSPSWDLEELCAWDPATLDYTAWSSHNPLVIDIEGTNNCSRYTALGHVEVNGSSSALKCMEGK